MAETSLPDWASKLLFWRPEKYRWDQESQSVVHAEGGHLDEEQISNILGSDWMAEYDIDTKGLGAVGTNTPMTMGIGKVAPESKTPPDNIGPTRPTMQQGMGDLTAMLGTNVADRYQAQLGGSILDPEVAKAADIKQKAEAERRKRSMMGPTNVISS